MKPKSRNAHIVDLLLCKYRADARSFRKYLPEIAQMFGAEHPRRQRSPFGLTEHERSHRAEALKRVVKDIEDGQASEAHAVRGLEHYATLSRDDGLPHEISHETLIALFKAATGKSPSSFKRVTTFSMKKDDIDKAVNQVSVMRGISLNLTWDMRLVSITVSPQKMRQRHKALKFIGIGNLIT